MEEEKNITTEIAYGKYGDLDFYEVTPATKLEIERLLGINK